MRKPVFAALLFIGSAALVSVSCEQRKAPQDQAAEAWNAANDPLNLSAQYKRNLNSLPTQGQVAQEPWSDWYWPNNLGGIAYRWTQNQSPWNYQTPTEEAVRQMSLEQIAGLSPAEKFDIFRGRFDYPTVQQERQRTHASDPDWTGICHGWAPAAYLFAEPKNIVLEGPSGVTIPFGSSDIKGLLSYYVGQVNTSPVRFLGTRCNIDLAANPGGSLRPECRDTNAGAFHVVLTNQMGVSRKSFIADVSRDQQVWNQPISGFQSRVIGEQNGASQGAAPGTVREVSFETKMLYITEISPMWKPVLGTSRQATDIATYRYRVELNQNGDIIGGEWLSEDRPDFLWISEGTQFSGPWQPLQNIYKAATQGAGPVPTPTPTVRPTIVPTVQPTVRPTVGPQPTVVPQPTVRPTVVPNPDHDQDVIIVHPMPDPFEGIFDQVYPENIKARCPGDYELKKHAEGIQYCAKNGKVLGPQPQKLQDDCRTKYGKDATFCEFEDWDEGFFKAVRGSEKCPIGTQWKAKFNTCVDGKFAYGPFPAKVVGKCQSQDQSCYQTNRLDARKLDKLYGE